jgi:hypothetical protein
VLWTAAEVEDGAGAANMKGAKSTVANKHGPSVIGKKNEKNERGWME